MTYLIWLGFFIGGWLLSKMDTVVKIKPLMIKYAEYGFKQGYTYAQVKADQPDTNDGNTDTGSNPIGFEMRRK